jgi:hypothetical protein
MYVTRFVIPACLFRFMKQLFPLVIIGLVTVGCGTDGGVTAESATPASSSVTSASPTPKPTPVVTVETVTETEAVPFARVEQEDPTMDADTSAVSTVGVEGVKTRTFEVTLTDGVETARRLVSEQITTAPVDEVTSIGTRQPPPPEPEPAAGGCDPNYSGCVPIDSDVDCAGGSGNGPSYADGPVTVTGRDIYGLDNDGDGVACE